MDNSKKCCIFALEKEINRIMAKYRYTMKVKKVVYYDEIEVEVVAENEFVAKDLAKEKAKTETFDDVSTIKYNTEVVSYTCKPVEE